MKKWIFNNTLNDKTYNGALFESSKYSEIPESVLGKVSENESVIADILNGDINISINGFEKIEDKNQQINLLKGFKIIQNTKPEAIASNMLTDEGRQLFTKIHGVSADVAAGSTHAFLFPIPYQEVLFQGAEIMCDVQSVADFKVKVPDGQGGFLDQYEEQYGFDVVMSDKKYVRESKYAARLTQGLVLECSVKNDSDQTRKMGVNFLLHEIRG